MNKLIEHRDNNKTIDEAFKKYLIPAKEKVRLKNKGIYYPECLDLINESGGVAVLAHPKSLDLSEKDFLIRLVLLFHDIGKPHSYQEGEVRHFKNHAKVSANMSKKILKI